MATPNSYYLVYRYPSDNCEISDRTLVGGMVIKCHKVYMGQPLGDWVTAHEVAMERYHTTPMEGLGIMEVFEDDLQQLANSLQARWDREVRQFKELMEVDQ